MMTAKPIHPAYGLTDEFRLRVLRDAAFLGVKAAAALHEVSPAAIYIWRKRVTFSEAKA
jgi:transposase-like protein